MMGMENRRMTLLAYNQTVISIGMETVNLMMTKLLTSQKSLMQLSVL